MYETQKGNYFFLLKEVINMYIFYCVTAKSIVNFTRTPNQSQKNCARYENCIEEEAGQLIT